MSMKKGQKAPRTVSQGLRARAWWVLRKNRVVTLAELLLSLNDDRYKCADGNLGRYMRGLYRAGILRRELVADGKPNSNGVYRYQLVKDLGKKAPVLRPGEVFDPNSNTAIPLEASHD